MFETGEASRRFTNFLCSVVAYGACEAVRGQSAVHTVRRALLMRSFYDVVQEHQVVSWAEKRELVLGALNEVAPRLNQYRLLQSEGSNRSLNWTVVGYGRPSAAFTFCFTA